MARGGFLSLRSKTLLLTGLLLALLVTGVQLVARQVLRRHFSDLEAREVTASLDQAEAALRGLQANLDLTARDWGNWDDAYEFVQHPHAEFVTANLTPASLQRLGADLIIFADRKGHPVHTATAPVRHGGSTVGPPQTTALALASLLHRGCRSAVSALLAQPRGILIVSAHPILTSKGQGPPRGVILVGRRLCYGRPQDLMVADGRTAAVCRLAEVDLSHRRPASSAADAARPADAVAPQADGTVAGWRVLHGAHRTPLAALRADLPRTTWQAGQRTIARLLWSLLGLSLLLGLTLLLVVELLVLRPLHRLSHDVDRVARGDDLRARLADGGADELGNLARGLNGMLGRLAASAAELRGRERTLNTILDSIPAGIVIVGEDRVVRRTNRTARQLMGLAADEDAVGCVCHECLCPAARGQCPVFDLGGTVDRAERVLRTRTGEVLPILKTAVLLELDGERVLLEAFVDIADLKAAQDAVAAAEELYRETLEALPDWVQVVEPGPRVLVSNSRYQALLGETATSAAMAGQPPEVAFPGLDPRLWRVTEGVLGGGPARDLETTVESPTGLRHLETRWVPVQSGGEVARVVTITRDVTRRKWDDLAMRLAEEKFRRLFEEAPVGIFQATLGGRLLAANEALAAMVGFASAHELLSAARMDPGEFLVAPRAMARAVRRALRYGEPVAVEADLRLPDQRVRPVWVRLHVVRDLSGQPQLLEGFVADMTEQKVAAAQLADTMRDLERSNGELEQFAYVASHDLQEPLRAVTSYLQLLQRRYGSRLDDDADTFIGFAVEGARRMQNLIQDLLAYSRVNTRGQELAATDLAVPWQEALANLELPRAQTGAIITHDPLPTVPADGRQLIQLFQNLLGNALKFRRAGETPRVHLSVSAAADHWLLSVRDNGIGLDPGYAERVFVIFQRLHGRDEYPGTGIGLAICKRIVERHGGRIWVESAVGQGATFHFTLARLPAGQETEQCAA